MNERAQRLEERLEPWYLVAALLVIPDVAIETAFDHGRWSAVATGLNWIVWLTFAVGLAATLALADERWRWLRARPLDVAIVVLTPPFAPAAFLGFRLARLVRLLRLVRLVRTARLTRQVFSLEGVRWATALTALVALGGGAAYAQAESSRHLSTGDGLRWAVTTMTTVGNDYGAQTGLGRLIAVAVMLVGIGFVAFITAAIAQRFVVQIEEPKPAWEAEVLGELKQISARLKAIEQRIGR